MFTCLILTHLTWMLKIIPDDNRAIFLTYQRSWYRPLWGAPPGKSHFHHHQHHRPGAILYVEHPLIFSPSWEARHATSSLLMWHVADPVPSSKVKCFTTLGAAGSSILVVVKFKTCVWLCVDHKIWAAWHVFLNWRNSRCDLIAVNHV